MPITKELKNVRNFESAGFTHEQAETLADAIEESHADSQEDLKEFTRNEHDKQNKDLDIKLGKLKLQISESETRLIASQKDLLVKIFTIIVGTVGVAVAIIKLF